LTSRSIDPALRRWMPEFETALEGRTNQGTTSPAQPSLLACERDFGSRLSLLREAPSEAIVN